MVQGNTYIASVMGITINGATPVFVEPDEFFNIDADKIEEKITEKTKAILVVHLYGQASNMGPIMEIAIIIVDYPVILGYSSADYFPSRVIFVEHLAITFYFLILSIYLGAYLYQRDFVSIKTSVVVILSFVFLSQMQDFGVRSLTSLKILKHLYKSDYKDFYSREMEMLEKIQSSLDNDVVLTIYRDQSKQQWTNLKPIELSTDKNNWVNNSVAKFFGKNSVVVKYDEGNKE